MCNFDYNCGYEDDDDDCVPRRLNGSYEALSIGVTSEALTDFTGGMIDRYQLKDNAPPRLFEIMLKAQKKGCLMGCSIDVRPCRNCIFKHLFI